MASEMGQGLTEAVTAEMATPPAETRDIESDLGFCVLCASQLKNPLSAGCKTLK